MENLFVKKRMMQGGALILGNFQNWEQIPSPGLRTQFSEVAMNCAVIT